MQCQGLWNDANLVEYYDIEKFKLVERNNIKTQITKKEKKKTKKVAKKEPKKDLSRYLDEEQIQALQKLVKIQICAYKWDANKWYDSAIFTKPGKNCSKYGSYNSAARYHEVSYNEFKNLISKGWRGKSKPLCYNFEKKIIDNFSKKCEVGSVELVYSHPADGKYSWYTSDKETKVVERKQKEFKPKKKDLDTDPPVIQIVEAITFNDSEYEFEGKVTDKSKHIFIEVDGRLVDVKKGKFKIKGYSPVDKEISIEAIDGHGNRSKPKIVKIIIDIKDTVVAEKLEPLNPSKIRVKTSKNKVALIIGIENYTEAPKANYANLDAKYFFDYARKAFGAKKQNINLLINEDATFVKTSKALTLWLRTKVKADQTDLIVFFAGHGLASSDGKELYLLPQDSDPNLLDITALSRTKLFQTIVDLKPKSVTMFLDTCYSGVSRDEQMLLASARPIRIVAGDEGKIPDNFTIFSATELDQISSGLKEAKHGIFSYYLMKGLEGKADANKNKEITNGELLAYMDQNISQKASELGRQQNPSLTGNPDQVLMKY
jgi:hypothetical protein